MTKKQLKEKYDAWNIAINERHDVELNDIFHELQDLSFEACGIRYCSLQMCLKEALKSDKADRALYLYDKYHEIEGAYMAFVELALDTDNFNIGKKG